jgi:uncharacterized protein (TIGR03435 family)
MGKSIRHAAIMGWLVTTASAAIVAQAPDSAKPVFEVATVKRNLSQSSDTSTRVDPGGRLRVVGAPLFWLIAAAYGGPQGGLRLEQVVGAPAWSRSERYDISAKAANADAEALREDITFISLRPFLQGLLEDRFRLTIHRETRQLPIYALVRARKDGELGPGLLPVAVDCAKVPAKCGFRGGPGRIQAESVSSDLLMQLLANASGRIVANRTGLDGPFRVDLAYAPDQTATDQPSIFTAVQEQLGLKLEATRAPVDVVVIDHVERPTED